MPTLKWQWHPKIMKNDDGAKEGMLRADVHGSNRSAATYWALTRAWTTGVHFSVYPLGVSVVMQSVDPHVSTSKFNNNRTQ